MRKPQQHAPLATAQPVSAAPEGRRAPNANALTCPPTGSQPVALMSLVRALARQASAEFLRAHGAQTSVPATPISHPPQEG